MTRANELLAPLLTLALATGCERNGGGAGGSTSGTAHTTATGAPGPATGSTASSGSPCGNGVVDPGEDCDGAALGTATCATLGFSAGTLACTAQCKFDTSGCTYPVWGGINVEQGFDTNNKASNTPTFFSSASASFVDPSGEIKPAEVMGTCSRYVYPYPGASLTYLNGGLIHITGGSISPITLTPTLNAGGLWLYPDGLAGNEQLFASGNTLHFDCAGNAPLPAFSGDVVAPPPIVVTAPANFDTLTTLPASMSWAPDGGGEVTLAVETFSNAAGETQYIFCTFPDGAGTGTLPATLLSKLDPNPTFTYAFVYRTNEKNITVGQRSYTLRVTTSRSRYYQP